jgi:peptide/nickel transport system substrate-binding protein
MTVNARDTLKKAVPGMRFQEQSTNTTDNILINPKRPPFDNLQVRQALNLALDRKSFIHSMYQDAAYVGGMMAPKPHGVWGLSPAEVERLPGFGDAAKNRAAARHLMQGLGYGPERPLKVTVSTRAVDIYVDSAVWVVSQLKEIYIDATIEQIETAAWHPKLVRRDFQLGVNLTSGGVDDPDAILFENYVCGSERNYSDYCDEGLTRQYHAQSAELDPARRLELVQEIDRRLQSEGVRPILAHRMEIVASWPYVHNLIAHQSVFNHWRMQEVWLDK